MTTMLELLRQLGLVVCTIALMLCVAGLEAPAVLVYVLAGIGGWAAAQYDSGYDRRRL